MHCGAAPTARSPRMPPDAPPMTAPPVERHAYDDALGRRIVELHVWAVQEGLRGVAASDLFDGFCQRLVTVGVPLWRGFVGTQTLHPPWRGLRHFWGGRPQEIHPPRFPPRGGGPPRRGRPPPL